MSGWLPPDDAAPQNEDERDEYEKLGEEIQRFESWVKEQCGRGYPVSMMLMIERIIADNKLNEFPKPEAAE